jgi:hypothetical protein
LRAHIANIHHRFGALARAYRTYSSQLGRANDRTSYIFIIVSARWRARIAYIHHHFGALARRSQTCITVSARWRALIANIHHRFGALARANRKYSSPFRRAGARVSQTFTTVSARWRARFAYIFTTVHHRLGARVGRPPVNLCSLVSRIHSSRCQGGLGGGLVAV